MNRYGSRNTSGRKGLQLAGLLLLAVLVALGGSELAGLDLADRFIFRAVSPMVEALSHGTSTVADFARVFRVPRISAEALLRGLLHLNLVAIEPGRADTYRVNQVLFPDIATVLRERHIL